MSAIIGLCYLNPKSFEMLLIKFDASSGRLPFQLHVTRRVRNYLDHSKETEITFNFIRDAYFITTAFRLLSDVAA